jgi:hypothetical protein
VRQLRDAVTNGHDPPGALAAQRLGSARQFVQRVEGVAEVQSGGIHGQFYLARARCVPRERGEPQRVQAARSGRAQLQRRCRGGNWHARQPGL